MLCVFLIFHKNSFSRFSYFAFTVPSYYLWILLIIMRKYIINSCLWGEFLTSNILLPTKAVPKLIGNWFCKPITFRNPIKAYSLIINIIFQFKHAPHKIKAVCYYWKTGFNRVFNYYWFRKSFRNQFFDSARDIFCQMVYLYLHIFDYKKFKKFNWKLSLQRNLFN